LLGDISPRDMIRFGRYAKLRQFVMDALAENATAVDHRGPVSVTDDARGAAKASAAR